MKKSFFCTFKFIAITITSLIAVSLLAGCSKDQETSQQKSKEREPALQQTASTSPVCEKKSLPCLRKEIFAVVTGCNH
jgi:uncharacterized lipoprotein YajG